MHKELKKYLSAYKFWWTVLTVFIALLIVVFIVCAIAGNDVEYAGLVVFVVALGLSLIPQYKSKKFYEKLEQDSQYWRIVEDFEKSLPMRKKTVRFGEQWIFRKGKEGFLKYEDITQVYQYIHKQNFVENERKLKYVDKAGKERTLCNLELRGKSDEEVKQMILLILNKNPDVKIGYT